MLIKVRKLLRYLIFPVNRITSILASQKYNSALDVGAGTGFFLEHLFNKGIILKGTGVEVKPKYFRKINKDIEIVKESVVTDRYDLIIFNDVLHHVVNKKELIFKYISKFLKPGGFVFVKEMNPEKRIFSYFNRTHDLIFANQLIQEISEQDLLKIIPNNLTQINKGYERVFMYNHYFVLFHDSAAT